MSDDVNEMYGVQWTLQNERFIYLNHTNREND